MAGMAYTTCMTDTAEKMTIGSCYATGNRGLKNLLNRIMVHTGFTLSHMSMRTGLGSGSAHMDAWLNSDGIVALDTHKRGDVVRFFTDPNDRPVATIACQEGTAYSLNFNGVSFNGKQGASITISNGQGMSLTLKLLNFPGMYLLKEWFPDIKEY